VGGGRDEIKVVMTFGERRCVENSRNTTILFSSKIASNHNSFKNDRLERDILTDGIVTFKH
jgi:hypothetical protein